MKTFLLLLSLCLFSSCASLGKPTGYSLSLDGKNYIVTAGVTYALSDSEGEKVKVKVTPVAPSPSPNPSPEPDPKKG